MWNNNKQKNMEDPSNSSNIISKGTILTGNLRADGNVRVEGKIIGDVTTRAKLALGSSSVIQGNILAHNAEFAGTDIPLAIFLVLELSSIANVTVFVAVVVFAVGVR